MKSVRTFIAVLALTCYVQGTCRIVQFTSTPYGFCDLNGDTCTLTAPYLLPISSGHVGVVGISTSGVVFPGQQTIVSIDDDGSVYQHGSSNYEASGSHSIDYYVTLPTSNGGGGTFGGSSITVKRSAIGSNWFVTFAESVCDAVPHTVMSTASSSQSSTTYFGSYLPRRGKSMVSLQWIAGGGGMYHISSPYTGIFTDHSGFAAADTAAVSGVPTWSSKTAGSYVAAGILITDAP